MRASPVVASLIDLLFSVFGFVLLLIIVLAVCRGRGDDRISRDFVVVRVVWRRAPERSGATGQLVTRTGRKLAYYESRGEARPSRDPVPDPSPTILFLADPSRDDGCVFIHPEGSAIRAVVWTTRAGTRELLPTSGPVRQEIPIEGTP